jgi:cellulose synthase operon protein C
VKKLIILVSIILLIVLQAACGNKQEDTGKQASQYLKSAEQLAKQGQLRAALIQAKNVIQIAPDSAQGYIKIAQIYNQIGYYSEVEKLLSDKLVNMPELGYELAYAHYQRKKYRSALDALTGSDINQDQSFRLLKSFCHLYLGEINEFEMEARKIAAVSSSDGYWSSAQGKAAQLQGDWPNAEKYLSGVSEGSPLYIDSMTRLAEVYIEQAKFDQAEKKLTGALSLTVNADTLTVEKAKILTMLVQILVRQGRSGEAYSYQKLLANANPELDSMKSRFDEAVDLYAKGEVEKSKNILIELHRVFPNNSNVTTLLGMIAFQQGQDNEAEVYFSQVIDPETATSGLIQASSLLKARNNKIDEAIKLLKDSVNAQPKNSQLLATYGLILLQNDPVDKEGAMALEKSVAMDPGQQRLRLALAERHYRLDEREQGLAQLETAFKNQPLDKIIQQTYLYQLLKIRGEKEVQLEIEQLKQQYPQEHQVRLIEAWWMIEQKQYAGAEKLLSELNGLTQKEKIDSYALLADLYLKQNKKDLAQKTLEEYLRLAPQAAPIYASWFELVSENKTNQAASFLQELQRLDDSNWQPYFYFALLKARTQQWDQVEQSLDLVLQKTSHSGIKQQIINLYNTYGFQLFRSGEFDQSQKIFIKALGVNPEDRTALYYYVQIALIQGQLAQARKILEPASNYQNSAIHVFLTGLIKEKEQKSEEALKCFHAAWQLEAFDLYAEKLYKIYQAKNDQKLLTDLINQWYQRMPESTQALLLVAMLQQEQGKTHDAISSYEKLLSKQPDNLVAMNNLAWLYLEVDLQKAGLLSEAAVKLAPTSADVLDTYAWILFKQDKIEPALAVANKAAKLAPDNLTIREHLDAIQRASEH